MIKTLLVMTVGQTDVQLVELLLADLDSPAAANTVRTKRLDRAAKWQAQGQAPLLALKLGHGRPLGLGSVSVSIDRVRRLETPPEGLPRLTTEEDQEALAAVAETAIRALAQKLNAFCDDAVDRWIEGVLLPWLQVRRYAGRKRFSHPRSADGTIYGFHTAERQKHAAGRKRGKPPSAPQPGGLKSLDQLDQEGR